MSPEVAEAAVASFARVLAPESDACVQISFYGGEALTNWRLVEHTVGYARELLGDDRVSFVLNTNATLVKELQARFCRSAGVDVHIGLDGVDEESNRSRRTRTGKPGFERAARGIEILANAGCRMQLNTVLTPTNTDKLESLIDWASARGIDRVYAAVPDLHGGAGPFRMDAFSVARRLWLARAAGRRRGVVFGGPWARAVFPGGARISPVWGSNGRIASFSQISVDGSGNAFWLPFPDVSIGRVGDGAVGDWFDSPVARRLLGEWERKFAKCDPCPLRESCGGYLRALSMYHQGNEDGVERQCDLALTVADMSPVAYADPGRFSTGGRLVTSGQLCHDNDEGQSRIAHLLRQDTFEVDARDRTLLAHFSGDGRTTVSCNAPGDLSRIVRLMDHAALLPADFDEELPWLTGELPDDYQPTKGRYCIVSARASSEHLVQASIDLVDETLDELRSCFIPHLRQPVLVVLADSEVVFSSFWSATTIPDWVTMYTAARRVLVIRVGAGDGLSGGALCARQQLRHELTHILIGQSRFNLPVWFEEGLCEYVARGPVTEAAWRAIEETPTIRFRDVEHIGVGTLIDLDPRPTCENPYYLHAWAFVTAMVEMLGEQRLLVLLRATTGGDSLGEICLRAEGTGLGELEDQWRASQGLPVANIELSENLVVLSGSHRSLLYDKVNGGAIRLDSAVADSITTSGFSPELLRSLPSRTLEALFSRGLLRIGAQEADQPRKVDRPQKISNLRLNLTDRCNMRCGYCYLDHMAAAKSPSMTGEMAIRALDAFFAHLAPDQTVDASVRFFGGEPLLNWPTIEAGLEYMATIAGSERVRKILNTNATNLRANQAESLAVHGVEVVVSLDGVKSVHDSQRRLAGGGGSFDKVVTGIECLLQAGCSVGAAVSVHHENLSHLHELIDWVADLQQRFGVPIPVGLNQLSIVDFPVAGEMAISSMVERVVSAVRHGERQGVDLSGSTLLKPWNSLLGRSRVGAYCSAIGDEVTVHPNGDISPCTPLKTRFGSIDDFDGAIASPAFARLAARVSGNIPECAGCEIEAYCAGACAADDVGGRSRAQVSADCSIRRSLFKGLVSAFAL